MGPGAAMTTSAGGQVGPEHDMSHAATLLYDLRAVAHNAAATACSQVEGEAGNADDMMREVELEASDPSVKVVDYEGRYTRRYLIM